MKEPDDKPRDLGVFAPKPVQPDLSVPEWAAGGLAVIWVVAVAAYVFTAPTDSGSLGFVLTLLVVFLPLALIWAAITTLRSVRALRAEAARLQATVDAMRAAYVSQQQGGLRPSVERKLDEIAATTRHTETALASFNSRRDTGLTQPSADRKAVMMAPSQQPEAEQPGLALGTPAEALHPGVCVEGGGIGTTPDHLVAVTFTLNRRAFAELERMAKAGLHALTQHLAMELAPHRIRVNAVNPGTADTPWVGRLLEQAADPAAERAALEGRQPMGRLVSAAEVASAISYLASPRQGSTTGTILAVDGGMQGLRLPK